MSFWDDECPPRECRSSLSSSSSLDFLDPPDDEGLDLASCLSSPGLLNPGFLQPPLEEADAGGGIILEDDDDDDLG